jgi:hypothetical protein
MAQAEHSCAVGHGVGVCLLSIPNLPEQTKSATFNGHLQPFNRMIRIIALYDYRPVYSIL